MANLVPQAGATSFKQTGYTKLWWGTDALGTTLGYIVVSANPKQRSETIGTEQGSGFTAVITQLVDGIDYAITVEEDLTIVPPHVGSVVILDNIFVAGTALGNVAPFGNVAIGNGNFVVVDNDFKGARKEVGQRVILAKAYVAIAALNGGGNPAI